MSVTPDLPESSERAADVLVRKAGEHLNAGRVAEAKSLLIDAVRAAPQEANAWHLLSACHGMLGEYAECEMCCRRLIALDATSYGAWVNLANALKFQERFEEAEQAYRYAMTLLPTHHDAYVNLGDMLHACRRFEEAAAILREAIRLQPDSAEAWNNLGISLYELGQYREAITAFQRATGLRPGYPEALCNLGDACQKAGRISDALTCYRQALTVRPRAFSWMRYGNILELTGAIEEAIDAYRKAVEMEPENREARGFIAFALNYHPAASRAEVFEAHCRIGRLNEASVSRNVPWRRAPIGRGGRRRLRIGYVSPDFRGHAVANFIEPVLRAHDRTAVEVYCYANVSDPDVFTDRLKPLADTWRDIHTLSDDDAGRLIAGDEIDILVDLAGYTANNRLGVFTRRPAPVQVTYLGYPNTTGMRAFDYRLTDGWADPVGDADRFHTEKLERLPHGFLCYQTRTDAPEVAPSPVGRRGVVGFGSFNSLYKINDTVAELWSKVLGAVPHSTLYLKNWALEDSFVRERLRDRFVRYGVSGDRIRFLGWHKDTGTHLVSYHDVDIAFDTFPYNGTTTTCEALWMGVPVITLAGDRHAGRVGVSLLNAVGFPEGIAATPEEYVAKACALAADREQLARLRRELRPRMAASRLCDAKGFVRDLEEAYRGMWRRWRDEASHRERTTNP